jgi:uncharacterized repeat protein (TIGR03803 family)
MKRHLTRIAKKHPVRILEAMVSGFVALAALSVLLLIVASPALAQTESVLYSFGSQASDGNYPDAGLIFDGNGNLYGTTQGGGAHGYGAVFELTAAGQEKVLYSFGSESSDGRGPYAGVTFDTAGNLYGTTLGGGADRCANAYVCGTVFELTAAGTEKVLHSFGNPYRYDGAQGDGTYPFAGVIFDDAGNLYGTTSFGGDLECGGYGCGTIFRLTSKGKGKIKEKILYRFGRHAGDGENPYAGLIFDNAGNLYGTTFDGGYYGYGTVFELTAAGKEKVLYSFGRYPGDGLHPEAGLIFDNAGNLYSTTIYGGAYGDGTVFELTADGTENILNSFGSPGDVENPIGGLIFDSNGNLYGSASFGGAYYAGAVFELTAAGTEKVLYTFGSQTGDGLYPYATPIFDNNGNLYGTTSHGGDLECEAPYGCGTVFKLTP